MRGIYKNVADLLSKSLAEEITANSLNQILVMLDLLIAIAPVAEADICSKLFALATKRLLAHENNAVQKKAYRLLGRLCETNAGQAVISDSRYAFLMNLTASSVHINTAAKRVSML